MSEIPGQSGHALPIPKRRLVPKAEVGRPYSITSSICASGDAGTVRLSALAALRLRTNATSQAAGRPPCFHCMKPSARTFPVTRLAVPTPQICRSLTQA
jgi:hypothetical protein